MSLPNPIMANKKPSILLTFDVEEFDLPLEYGQQVPLEEQLQTGKEGFDVLMKLLEPFGLEATFFTTANFAQHYPQEIKGISGNHEIASHTFYHSTFQPADLASSKQLLEQITGKEVFGLRMPRMRAVEMEDVKQAGYTYDSSINPAWVPGRYNNRHLPRTPYHQNGMLRFPASVTPNFRIPLFWLSFKNFPYFFFKKMLTDVLKKDGYACLYLHPWEFINLDKYTIPAYAKRHAGKELQKRLVQLINDFQNDASFISMHRYITAVFYTGGHEPLSTCGEGLG